MINFHFALPIQDYSWKNALLWKNCLGHYRKVREANFYGRCIHLLIAAVESLPLIGQIASIFEKIVINHLCHSRSISKSLIKIQKFLRRSLRRLQAKKRELLFEQARLLTRQPEKLASLPRAQQDAAKRVYLPDELPLVLKYKHNDEISASIFKKMGQARKMVRKKGYRHLVIPRAQVYDSFIIEHRLPVRNHEHNEKLQIDFYLDHQEQLTEAIKDFTSFLCQAGGIVLNLGRKKYDHVAMYLEGGVGKIGLMNLTHFFPIPEELQKTLSSLHNVCIDAIQLFPYHLETILAVAKSFNSDIERHALQELKETKEQVLEDLKQYLDYKDFLLQKNILLTTPPNFLIFQNLINNR